jgi:hypothetical protein
MTTPSKLPLSFSESEAQRVLARAAELEVTTGGRLTIDELRQIAEKAGIDSAALEHAIHESSGSIGQQFTLGSPAPIMKPRRFGVLASVGVLLGALAAGIDGMNFPFNSEIAVLGPSVLFTAWRALRHPVREGTIGLLRELAVVFGSFTIAVIFGEGLEATAPALGWSVLCGILAAGIMSVRAADPPSSDSTRVLTPLP